MEVWQAAGLALIALALLILVGLVCVCHVRSLGHGPRRQERGRRTWTRRPRTPDDCVACRTPESRVASPAARSATVPPWRDGRPRRGPPRRIVTQGHACPSPTCPYQGITDATVHALIGYGHHGTTDRIQDFLCQACGTKVSARRNTALYHLKTSPQRVGEVLSALAEGMSVEASARVFAHGEPTIRGWLTRAGTHAERVHRQLFQGLQLPHVQLDELRTRLRLRRRVLWVWLAVDPCTKIIPVLHLGPRTQESAQAVVHTLCTVLAPGCVPVVTSDGLALYYYALTAHFGQWVQRGRRRRWQVAPTLLYGQVLKRYRRRRLVTVTRRMLCGTMRHLRAAFDWG